MYVYTYMYLCVYMSMDYGLGLCMGLRDNRLKRWENKRVQVPLTGLHSRTYSVCKYYV